MLDRACATAPWNTIVVTTQKTLEPPLTATVPREASGTILAFDFGERRIGVAVGEVALRMAHPLTTITSTSKLQRYEAIAPLIAEWRPGLLVVGLPMHMDGTEHEMSRLARKFGRDLFNRFGVPVEWVDERLSSAMAEASLGEAGVSSRKRKPVLDQVAAQHILQAYLDTRGFSR